MTSNRQAVANVHYAEQAAWLWALQIQGFTYAQMRELSKRPTSRGGLGVELSEAVISRRINEHAGLKVEMLDELRPSWAAIELERLEEVHRSYVAMAQPFDADREPRSLATQNMGLQGILSVSRERRKLMGTDAPTKAEIRVEQIQNEDLDLMALLRTEDEKLRRG
jgi:hypothetical protein